MQKPAKGNRRLARHQLNAPRQGDHLQLLAGAQAKLLTHPLGDDNLVLGGNGYEIHEGSVAQDHNRSGSGTRPSCRLGSSPLTRSSMPPEAISAVGTTRMFATVAITLASIAVAVFLQQGDHISDLPFVGGGGFELVEELDTIASSLASSSAKRSSSFLSRSSSLCICSSLCSIAYCRTLVSIVGCQLSFCKSRRQGGSDARNSCLLR